jgi:sugar lactone lactonase YvrE
MRFVTRGVLPCLILCACGVFGTRAFASGPAFWTVASASEFLRGQSDGVFVSLAGVVSAGPQLTNRLTSTPAQVWALAAAPDGTLWAGTGGDGKVLRLRQGQAEEAVFDPEEANVFSVAVSGNRVYAATGPDGKVYVIENGAARTFFDPAEKYIWALAVDGSGRLWVGAGNPAVIYRVDASGANRVVYRPPAAHVVTLVADRSGRMLAGTESPGRLYRFESDDRPFVLLDSGLTELRAISPAPGTSGVLFAAAVGRGDEPAASGGETASVGLAAPPPATGPAPAASTSRKSIVFRIEASGVWEAIWESSDVLYDLSATNDGGVLAASGAEGRLYRIERNREVLLLTGVDAKQITRFAGTAESPVFATANPGRVFVTGSRIQSPASYVSAVRDTKGVSKWGILRWQSTGSVALYTRSGNTDKPDDSWSNWDGPYSRKEGDAIRSPAARFLQWRAVLTQAAGGPAAQLTSVTAAYLPNNNRPLVISITIPPPGVVFQRPFSSEDGAIAGLDDVTADARRPPGDPGPPTPSPGRRMFQKGLQTVTWKADDGDADHMSYSLQYRREGDQTWHDLRRGLTDPIFVWDTTSVADGRYILKVLASDDPSNAADRALVGERESDPIEIDNTPPTFTTEIARTGGTLRLVIRVHDARSAIQKVEYSLGGAAWQVIYPVDKVADAPDEQYEIPLQNDADAARIVLRAFDVLQNVVSQPAVVR